MPVISKETLKAMKAFTDKLIEAGDINDGSVSGYFTRVRDDASYPQGVHDAAEEISKIFFNSKYPGQTSLFSELTQAKTFLDQMTADPNYPDGTPDAEEKCGVIMDVFKKYYDVYGDLAFYVNEFNKENNYVELGKRNSELRPLMPKINAYMNIDTFYSLFVLQSKNGNIENKVNNLRKTDRELNKLSGFMKYEKDIDLKAYEYKKLKTDYEDKEKFAKLIFENTTTIGIRYCLKDRFVLERREETVTTRYGDVKVKISEGFGVKKAKPGYDDISGLIGRD